MKCDIQSNFLPPYHMMNLDHRVQGLMEKKPNSALPFLSLPMGSATRPTVKLGSGHTCFHTVHIAIIIFLRQRKVCWLLKLCMIHHSRLLSTLGLMIRNMLLVWFCTFTIPPAEGFEDV